VAPEPHWVRAAGRPIPGGYVVESEHFLVEHAPLQESSAGTVIVEARRHLLDFGEMTPTESAELGSILHRLVPTMKNCDRGPARVLPGVMERAPHFHLWLVPKKNDGELRGTAYLAQEPPLTASYSEAEAMTRNIRAEFERSYPLGRAVDFAYAGAGGRPIKPTRRAARL
jgi:diadenosine tetraphosphate (Ap4A) HIT family hydrolase